MKMMIGIVIITVIAFGLLVGGTFVGEAEDGGLHIFFVLFLLLLCFVVCLSLFDLSLSLLSHSY